MNALGLEFVLLEIELQINYDFGMRGAYKWWTWPQFNWDEVRFLKWLANQTVQCTKWNETKKNMYSKRIAQGVSMIIDGHYRQLIELKPIFVDSNYGDEIGHLFGTKLSKAEAFVIQFIHIRIKCNICHSCTYDTVCGGNRSFLSFERAALNLSFLWPTNANQLVF